MKGLSKYTSFYDSKSIRHNSYDIGEIVSNYYKSSNVKKVLDLGCGSCRKAINLSKLVDEYYGVDISQEMLSVAQRNKKIYNLHNLNLLCCSNHYLPFDADSFDLVSCFLSSYDLSEVTRVLKPNGTFILETLSVNDKYEMKRKFGKDSYGWRGILMQRSYKEQICEIQTILEPFFYDIEIIHKKYESSFTIESLFELLSMTPTIRDFPLSGDLEILGSLIDETNCIRVTEEKLIVIAIKK